jgi:hypothetical protein
MPRSSLADNIPPFAELLENRYLLSSSFSSASIISISDASNFFAIQRLLGSPAESIKHSKPTTNPRPPVVAATPNAGAAAGLIGQYFLGSAFQNLVLTRTDLTVNFNWSVTPDPAVASRPFSIRWTGQVTAGFNQTYTFTVRGNVGARLWVNGKQLVNDWKAHRLKSDTGRIKLHAGTAYDLRLDSFQTGSAAGSIQVLWSSARQKTQVIPAKALTANSDLLPTLAPAAPAGLTAIAASSTHVSLSWTAAANAAGYTVQRSTDGISFTTLGTTAASQLSFDDTAAVPATKYYYEVSATNSGGASAPSSPASATTPPLAPGGLSAASVSATQIDLTWNDVTGATGFEVLASTDGGAHFTVVGTAGIHSTLFHTTGLMPATGYAFEVVATCGGALSAAGNIAQAITPTTAPQSLAVHAATSTRIDLTWNDVSSEQGFIIERSADGATGWVAVGTTPAGVVHASDTGLAALTSYFYRVRAVSAGGNSDPGTVAGDTTPAGVRYQYVTDHASYTAVSGSTVTVRLYLQETLDAGYSSLLAGVGLFAAGAGVLRVSGSDASITGLAADTSDFAGPSGINFTAADALLIEAISFAAPGVQLANTGGGASPATLANEIYLGSLTIAVGPVPGGTTFSLGRHDPQNGNTLTYQSGNDLDQSTGAAYTGVGLITSLFTVTAT